eukprot:2771944-Pyramimonas_sp.AAC.1
MRPPQTAHRRAAQDLSKAKAAIATMPKDLADKKDQYEKLRLSIEEREQTLEAKKVQLAVLQAEFDRTAALVSPKEENADR